MMKSRIAFVLSLAPAILAAQSATSSVTSATSARADIPASYSVESRAKLNATFAAARERSLPDRPIRDRIAEGQAKGASEAQVVVAAQRAESRLEATQTAMVRAGRQPSDAELIQGEHAMARGATEAQIEAIVRHTPPERSVVVALDALVAAPAVNANAVMNASVATPKVDAAASATATVGALIKPPQF
jgi:hypothetical protein